MIISEKGLCVGYTMCIKSSKRSLRGNVLTVRQLSVADNSR